MPKLKLSKKPSLTEPELAKYWGVKQNTLQKWRNAGCGPIYVNIGGKVIYKRRDIAAYEKGRTFQGTAERIFETKRGGQ